MKPFRLKSVAMFAAGLSLFVSVSFANAKPRSDACDLPKELQTIVEAKFPATKIVNLSDLSEEDRQLFQKGHADSCPGLVKVDFYGDGKPTFALALRTNTRTYPQTKLVLAHQVEENWEATILGKTDGPIPVIWSEKPGEYKSVYGKKIRTTRPVIVFCGYSSWAVLYAWTNDKIAKIWLRD